MTIYYQHIGEPLWRRDAPLSIGTEQGGIKRFGWADIAPFLGDLDEYEFQLIQAKIEELAPTGFQIWGIPSGATYVLKNMETGHFLMLLEKSHFRYTGQVIHRITLPQRLLLNQIWGESKFPIIILLQGELISYEWAEFKKEFGIKPNYDLRGSTANLSEARILQSRFQTEDAFIASIATKNATVPSDQQIDFEAFSENLRVHFRLVKERAGQQAFRENIAKSQGMKCTVCDIAISAALDAAHIVPKEHKGTDKVGNGLMFCSLHHRLFDANFFNIEPSTGRLIAEGVHSLTDMRMIRNDISHVQNPPNKIALQWRWDNRKQVKPHA